MAQFTRSERRKARALEKLFLRRQPSAPKQNTFFASIDYASVEERCLATVCLMHREKNGVIVVDALTTEEIYGFKEKGGHQSRLR